MECRSSNYTYRRVPRLLVLTILLGLLSYCLGVPLVSSQGLFLRSAYSPGELPFDPKSPRWEKTSPIVVPLSGQVISSPAHPKLSIESLTVRSLHNGKDIVFLVEWDDPTKNDRLTAGTFRDGVALAFPLNDALPFFCMGQAGNYVNIWHWKADWQADIDRHKLDERDDGVPRPRTLELRPRRVSSVEDLLGCGFATMTTKRVQGTVQGNAIWDQSHWKVVFKRALQTRDQDNDAVFDPALVQAVAFAVWNGETKERAGKKAVASWLQLVLDSLP